MPPAQDEKKPTFSKQQTDIFDLILKNLSMALKNSVLYASEHPIFTTSIENFKASLDGWFATQSSFDLGVSPDALFIGAMRVGEGNERYMEVANHLHVRGIISISFMKGIELSELNDFFCFMKDDKKVIRDKGGVVKNIPPAAHMHIKEIDYSALLTKGSKPSEASDEGKIWEFLFDIGKDIKAGVSLPESKVEFLADFFKDSNKSASVINKVYKEAVSKMEDEEASKNIRATVAKVCEYFEKHSTDKGKEVKVELMRVVSQLHPDLINILFEKTVIDDHNFDLAEEVTKDFSDTYIAGFIESLISQEDSFNENMLKVFDKLAPGETRANSVVSMVADRLLGRRILNADALSKMQTSIKEIFKAHPQSNFMNQMYNITVDAVINKKVDTLIYVARLSPLLNKFAQSLAEDKLKKEEIWLLLNILWLESNPLEFNKFSSKLVGTLSDLLDEKDTVRIREILLFFTEKMRPEQLSDERMSVEIKDVISRLTSKEAIDSIISFIPEATVKSLEDIADILFRSGHRSASPLIDAYLNEKSPAQKNKYKAIFAKNIEAIVDEVITRLEYVDILYARELLEILREYDADKANLVSKRLLWHKDPRLRWEGLEAFDPKTEEDRSTLFLVFRKEKDREVRKKAASTLLETRDPAAVKQLFEFTEKGFFTSAFLPQLVEACGKIRCQEAFPHLRRVFLKKAFFNTASRDNLRVTVITTLGRLRTPEAMEIIREGSGDKSQKVRKLCEILLKLDHASSGKQQNDEERQYGAR